MANGKLTAALAWVRRTAVEGGSADSELLERFVTHGDEAAFELLVWRYQRLVFGVCRRLLTNVHDAEDAFQAAFLVLARRGKSVNRGASLAAWLYRVAYRCALTVRAARERRARRECPLVADPVAVGPDDASHSAEQRELRHVLDEELARLPERFRAPAILCYLAGKTVDEAAQTLGCPRGTVASRLARARERLRLRLAQRGVVLPAGAVAIILTQAADAGPLPDLLVRVTVTNLSLQAAGRAASDVAAVVANQVVQAMLLRKMLIGLVLALCAGVLLVGGGFGYTLLAQDRAEPPIAPVQAPASKSNAVQPPAPEAPLPPVEYVGRLQPSQQINVRAQVKGVIDKVLIKLGDTVKPGDVFFQIDMKAAEAELTQAQANAAAADARGQLAGANLARMEKLVEQKAVEQNALAEGRAEVAVAAAAQVAARANLALAQLRVERSRITAPIAGRVAMLSAHVGDLTIDNGNVLALATIIHVDPLTVRFDMDERTYIRYQQLKRAGKVQDVALHLRLGSSDEKGYPHTARFQSFAGQFDEKTDTITVRGTLPNPQGDFLPGMFVRVRVSFVPPPAKR